MGGKVVLTYKRKRPRSDHSRLSLCCDVPSEISEPKNSANFDEHEGSVAEFRVQNKKTEFAICCDQVKEKSGEIVQCENCNSRAYFQWYENGKRRRSLCCACNKQQNSSIVNHTQNSSGEEQNKQAPESDVKKETFSSNVLLEGSHAEKYQFDSSCQSNGGEKSDQNKETISTLPPPDVCSAIESDPECYRTSDGKVCCSGKKGTSISGKCTLVETDKPDTDQLSSLFDNNVAKCKWASPIITFTRQAKRTRAVDPQDIASEYAPTVSGPEEQPHACFSVDLSSEKVTTLTNCFSGDEENKPCKNIDLNSGRMTSDASGKRDSVSSAHLSISLPASGDVDCNVALKCSLDENHPPQSLDVLHDSSNIKIKESMPDSQLPCEDDHQASILVDQGKCPTDSMPELTGTISKSNYLQLFPEFRSNGPEKLVAYTAPEESRSWLKQATLRLSPTHDLSMQPEQMVNGSSLHEQTGVHSRYGEGFQDFLLSTLNKAQLVSRHRKMLDGFSTRLRNKVEYPTTWSEEELDCLWVGVRRHGRGNWDAILSDCRLHFFPWRTPRDLAERWLEEQTRLVYGNMPVSQVKYVNPTNFSSHHINGQLHPQSKVSAHDIRHSLGAPYECSVQNRPLVDFMNFQRNRQLQSYGNLSSHSHFGKCCLGLVSRSEGNAMLQDVSSGAFVGCPLFRQHPGFHEQCHPSSVKESLPHWLKEAAVIHPRTLDPAQMAVSSVCDSQLNQRCAECTRTTQQPWLNNRCTSTQRSTKTPYTNSPLVMGRGKTEPDTARAGKQDNSVVLIESNASSEETISDDRISRP